MTKPPAHDSRTEFSAGASRTLVVFHLDERRFALHLAAVERVLPIVEIVPLPQAPEIVLGVVNVEGRIIPVVDIRSRFSLPRRPVALSDHLLIARTKAHPVALAVDAVAGVLTPHEIISAEKILEKATYVEGVAKLSGDLIFIHDLDTFLSLAESSALAAALAANGSS